MTENTLNELILYDNLIGKAVDEIISLQSQLDNAQGSESRINPVAWYIEEVMGGRLPQETPAAGPWNYDLNAAPVGIWLLGKRNGAVIKCLIMKDKNGEWSDSEHRLYLSIDAFAEINTEGL